MTVEQYKELKKKQKEHREFQVEFFRIEKKRSRENCEKLGKKDTDSYIKKFYKLPNQRLKLPKTSFSKKIRKAMDEMILNDIAAVEGGIDLEDAFDNLYWLKSFMDEVTGKKPESIFYFMRDSIPDIRQGFITPEWEGNIDSIISIIERNGLSAIYKEKLIIREII